MDVHKRYTDTNVELKAQGIGNILSSLIGGLPMTSVVVRSSANNSAGAKSKMSAIIHGVLLLISVLAVPVILNKIPLATLATILILVDINWPNRRPLFTFGKRKISIYSFYYSGSCSNN
jgi:MFS superfamily sulfate permease-like transporter